MVPLQGAKVSSVVGELRSHPKAWPKKRERKRLMENMISNVKKNKAEFLPYNLRIPHEFKVKVYKKKDKETNKKKY